MWNLDKYQKMCLRPGYNCVSSVNKVNLSTKQRDIKARLEPLTRYNYLNESGHLNTPNLLKLCQFILNWSHSLQNLWCTDKSHKPFKSKSNLIFNNRKFPENRLVLNSIDHLYHLSRMPFVNHDVALIFEFWGWSSLITDSHPVCEVIWSLSARRWMRNGFKKPDASFSVTPPPDTKSSHLQTSTIRRRWRWRKEWMSSLPTITAICRERERRRVIKLWKIQWFLMHSRSLRALYVINTTVNRSTAMVSSEMCTDLHSPSCFCEM